MIIQTGADSLLRNLGLIFVEILFPISFIHQLQVFFNITVEYFVAHAFFISINCILYFMFAFFFLLTFNLINIFRLCNSEFVLELNHSLGFLDSLIP